MTNYVLVNTHFDFTPGDGRQREVGAVYGPFASKEAAEQARDEMEFPNPEYVFVRCIHVP